MNTTDIAWYCVRTKPKHEHIAAASVRDRLGLEVFYPRLRMERMTRRGIVRMVEPLFPCYLFVRCALTEMQSQVRYSIGVNSVVHFNTHVPSVSDSTVEELRNSFDREELITTRESLGPGMEVLVAEGAFEGMQARVLRVLPAKQRVQVLLAVLGRPTPVEISRGSVMLEQWNLRDLVPFFATPHLESVRM